jgi:hypothetical protein
MLLALIVTAAFAVQTAQRNAAMHSALPTRAGILNSLYLAEPGESGLEESIMLGNRDAFLDDRYTYPTGKADRRWLFEAAKQDKLVRSGIPAGRVTYKGPSSPNAPDVLDAAQWISIGPQPQQSETCTVCFPFVEVAGRVNDIVVDPISPTIAYIASDGGGVWKTTNCCSAATTWLPTMDDPYISTIAIGDLAIEPDGHTVYAGTGDLRFGSFSFGSAGLLKSTDFGATWEIKGYDVFEPKYPQPAGAYPQYNSIGKVAINPHDNNDLAVGTKLGMYFSYDEGDTWAGPCLPNPYPTQRQDITGILAMTRTNTLSDLFVAVGARGYSTTVQYNLAENGANGIYKATWPSSGCPNDWSLKSLPAPNDDLSKGWPPGTGSGVPQYVGGGNQVGRIDLAYAESNPNYIYAEVQAINPGFGAIQRGGLLGIWRSTDRGETWEQRTTAHDLEAAEVECGGTCLEDSLLGVCGDVAQNWYDQHIVVDPNNPEVIFFDNINVWKSTNGGNTVKDLTCGYSSIQVPRPVHVDQHAITFLPGSSSRQLIGNDGGVYFTENANTTQPVYVQLNTSLSTIEFYGGDISAEFATSAAPFAVAGAQDNGSSSWQGTTNVAASPKVWQQRIGGDGMFARIEPVLGQRIYMEAQYGAIRRSDTGHPGPYQLGCLDDSTIPNVPGCVPVNFGVDGARVGFVFPYELYKGVPSGKGPGDECSQTEGCLHFIGGTYRVWEHLDGLRDGSSEGVPWYPSSPDLTKGTLGDRSYINQLAFAFRTDKIAIAGTNDGNVWIGFGLGAGQNISSTWKNLTGGNAVLPNRPILDVVLDANVVSTTTTPVGYAAVGGFNENTPSQPGHVFKVTCGANCNTSTWLDKSGNLPNVPVNAITLNPNFPQQVFAGTDWGVYYTNDINAGTPVWFRFNQGMPNVMIWDFAVDRGFTTLAAFTRSRGAYVWPFPDAPFEQTATPTGTGTPPNTATASATAQTRTPDVPPSYTAGPSNTPTITSTPFATATMLACGSERPLFERFESGTLGAFTAKQETTTGTNQWIVTDDVVYTGRYSAWVDNNEDVSLQALEMTNAITIPTSSTAAQMEFWHRYSFEDEIVPFDGGLLEYSTDNGANWTDAGDLITEGGYNGTIILGQSNPNAGRDAWVNQSPSHPNFNRVVVNLTSLKGKSVKMRFLHSSDPSTGGEGWFVDDVVLTYTGQCVPATATVTATACPVQFQDVPASTDVSSFYPYVRCLACRGIVGGYPCGGTNPETGQAEPCGTSNNPYYRPSNSITRGQISKLVSEASGLSGNPGGQIYEDVEPGSPFYPWINRLSAANVMGGYPCGGPNEPCEQGNRPYFRPGANATRGQMSKIVSNAAGFNDPVSGQSFEDVPPSNSPSSYYVYVERLHVRGIVGGYPCGGDDEPCEDDSRPYFRPNSQVTRGQAAKIVSNTFFPNCQSPARP